MLSSMSPTIISKDGKFVMAVGAMGGPKIITSTLQTIINVLDFEMTLQEAINAPRIHHQWYPHRIMGLKGYGRSLHQIPGTCLGQRSL